MHDIKLSKIGAPLIAACVVVLSVGQTQEVGEVDNAESANEVELAQVVHFDSVSGGDVQLEAGRYLVLPAGERELEIVPLLGDGASARLLSEQSVIITAADSSHEEEIFSPQAMLIAGEEDMPHIVLLMPGGESLDAAGFPTGVRERGMTTSRISATRISSSRVRYSNQSLQAYKIAQVKQQIAKQAACPEFVTVQIPDELNVTLWTLAEGDAEIGGTGQDGKLSIYTWLRHTPMRLWLRGRVFARETQADHTRFEGSFTKIFFDARQYGKCEIASVGVKTFTAGEVTHHGRLVIRKDRGKSGVFPGENGIVREANCRFNSKGSDVGKLGCSRISFHSVKVYLKPVRDNCGITDIYLPDSKFVFPLQHRSGNKDISGNWRQIALANSPDGRAGPLAQVLRDGRVHISGAVRIQELAGDHSEFATSFAFDVFGQPDAPDHCKASRITGVNFDNTQSYGIRDHRWQSYQARGLVQRMQCRTDTSGSDEPKTGGGIGCELDFRRITLEMTKR